MTEPTQPVRQTAMPQGVGLNWCAYHEALSATTVQVWDGGGHVVRACFSCREAYDLTPASGPASAS
ncbi:hypothetical protein [Streptomyces sp. NPDC048663]|uniref:hypothetical protein n=1 Tax=Streptomyces sp. NPDC048663 TaxID=3155638 RepID=UPI003428B656